MTVQSTFLKEIRDILLNCTKYYQIDLQISMINLV